MIRKILTSAFMIMLLCVPFLAADSKADGQNINTLPWEIIAEKFDAKEPFCTAKSKDEKTINFALTPDVLTITLPSNNKILQEQTEAELDLSVWQQGQWTDLPPLTVQIEANSIKVGGNAITEGFYNLSLVFDKNEADKENNFYAIVTANWKKALLSWCRKNKEHIETNPDHQLIYSSIVVSHFDNLMELSVKPELSGNMLSTLSKLIKAKLDFEEGNCPDFVTGLNKIRLRRFMGAAVAEFVVFVPEDYDGSRKWPIFLEVDHRRWAAGKNYPTRSGAIDMWWHTVSHNDLRWKDYKAIMKIIEEKLNVDEDRIYIKGICENGVSSMALVLNYPDQWAECSIVLGNSYRHLAGNVLNLPLIFVDTHAEVPSLRGYYNFAVKSFQYYGCRYFKYSGIQNIEQTRGSPMPDVLRENSPQRVLYTIESLANPKSYWLSINGREDENLTGMIDASVDGQTIFVKTNNVDAYSLDLIQAPIDSNEPVEIVENGVSLGFVTDQIFTKRAEKYSNAVLIKNERLHGPIWDVFTDPYIVVSGTGAEDPKFIKASKALADSLSDCAPIFNDVNLPEEVIGTDNLILIGKMKSNLWFSEIYKNLPVQINEGHLWANGKCYDGNDTGYIFIYPNPVNSERYVAVFSGISSTAMANVSKAYWQMQTINPADVGIFEVVEDNKLKWHILEKLNTVWGWHNELERVLAVTNKDHPEWQWQQWVGKVVREQLKADVVICEDIFKFENITLINQIKYRDLFNSFKNHWIVKIELDGRSLKDLLMVPSNNIFKKSVVRPVIDGVSFAKPDGDNQATSLVVNQLDNDKKYLVALSQKIINGARMGIVLTDYKITGEGYLIPMLKDYLCKNKNLDIDNQLDGLKFNMF